MKRIPICIALFLSWTVICAESRVWTLANGRTFEAEFMTVIGGEVSLKNPKGKLIKVPEKKFSEADLKFIQLEMPPQLDINFSKKSKQRIFPFSLSALPNSSYFDFGVTIKQLSTKPYDQELKAEYFAIGDEAAGDLHILLDYQTRNFFLTKENNRTVEFSGETVELLVYELNTQKRGKKFRGYLVLITDARGKIIAHKATSKFFYENLENLRTVPIGKYFDETCTRVSPTRPKRWY